MNIWLNWEILENMCKPRMTATHGSSWKIIHDHGYLMDKVAQKWIIIQETNVYEVL